jgi:hypothetical protein
MSREGKEVIHTMAESTFPYLITLITGGGFEVVRVGDDATDVDQRGLYVILDRDGNRVGTMRDEHLWWNSPHKP